MPHHGEGPIPAKFMIVGECWGEQEDRTGLPFQGPSGQELNRMLGEAKILRSDCYVSNVVNYRPPNNYLGAWIAPTKKAVTTAHVPLRDKMVLPLVVEGYQALLKEIYLVQPDMIITVGNLSMWALTGRWGIMKWRGSHLMSDVAGIKTIPTIHPASILREWSNRPLVVSDLKRAARHATKEPYSPPKWNFLLKPTFGEVTMRLTELLRQAEDAPIWLDIDIETKVGHIACLGISWTKLDALCIPFMCSSNRNGYWSTEEEIQIVWLIRELFKHRNVHPRWQNGLYDAQYLNKHWLVIPGAQHEQGQDTMISQHSMFCALSKGLGFLGSMYADWYVYWKDEGKNTDGKLTDERNWAYNCQDCVYTREVGEVTKSAIVKMGLEKVEEVQQRMFWPVLKAMIRGIRVIPEARDKLAADIQAELSARQAFLFDILGHPVNPKSPKQMQALLYNDLGLKPVMKRKMVEGRMQLKPTTDDEALTQLALREPLVKPICNAIADIRTLTKWLNDFVLMPLDEDGRMRCSFNVAGDAAGKSAPYSYRLSSSENAFGSGGNLQTIPSSGSKSAGKAKARGSMEFDLPNIRSMFGPDPGNTFFDVDLDRADLQVVAWEANDELLKAALRVGSDIHLLNVFVLDGKDPPPLEELVEGHPKYWDYREPRNHRREFAKVFCHATDYVGSAKTVAAHTGRTIHEVDKAQKIWFGAHPGILDWHKRVAEQIRRFRFVENKFGYRWYIFDRTDDILPAAVAWGPQSTVGCVINRIWLNVYETAPAVEVLLQVHDSLAGQFPTAQKDICVAKIQAASHIVIPYDDPLIIPCGIKTSEISWGACKK